MKPYDKANSILEIRDRSPEGEDLFPRLRKLRDGLGNTDRQAVVRRACDNVLGEPTPDDAPRFTLRPHVIAELRRLPESMLERYLFYRYRYDTYPVTHELDDFPPCLQIEPTAICNYRCVFCYQTDASLTTPKNGHMNIMSLDLFKRVIDEAEGRCEAVTLASRGEPLMARDIVAMLGYAAGKFTALKVNTNAWFLDEVRSRALLEADLNTLVFSADAADPELYSRLRVNGKLDRVLKNIEAFSALRQREYPEARVITRVAGVRFTEEQQMTGMEDLWGGLVDQVAFVDYNPWENTYAQPDTDVSAPCSDLWRRMFVWADGRVNPCDVDYLSTLSPGRLEPLSVSELWRGEAYQRLRDEHTSGRRTELSPCKKCTVV
jgi:uncharacterized Fe-S cluster-containing radical SAM superfamily protein